MSGKLIAIIAVALLLGNQPIAAAVAVAAMAYLL